MSKRSNNKTSVCTILNCAAVLLVFLFASGLNNPATSTAAEPPSEPILRINTEMHTAAIIRIGVDAESKYLVTGSEDKTVKVWDISSGRLLQTLRVPIGDGDEGKVAISPDGRTIVCGGWTGAEWDNKTASIYIFDRQTGKLIKRIAELPNVIHHLAYSKDGRFLVATLDGKTAYVFMKQIIILLLPQTVITAI